MGGNEADAGVSMGRAKDITMKVIPGSVANPFIRAHHYSGKVVNNSKLHFGVFLDGQLHGVMSYGPSLVYLIHPPCIRVLDKLII